MTTNTRQQFVVMHALRVCGLASTDRVAAFVAQPAVEVDGLLRALEADGLVKERTGRMVGWLLTPSGRARHDENLRLELSNASRPDQVRGGYERFLAHNVELKRLCTEWQLRVVAGGEPELNDHSDAEYDQTVIASLVAMHDRAGPMFDQLASALGRFAHYQPRLEQALSRLQVGDRSAFARPLSASYHCVWMELHEDLLATLCRDRDDADGH